MDFILIIIRIQKFLQCLEKIWGLETMFIKFVLCKFKRMLFVFCNMYKLIIRVKSIKLFQLHILARIQLLSYSFINEIDITYLEKSTFKIS